MFSLTYSLKSSCIRIKYQSALLLSELGTVFLELETEPQWIRKNRFSFFSLRKTQLDCLYRIAISMYKCWQGRDFENPPPGSVVDNTITRRTLFDFFLVSQLVRQGTVTPTHYVVLHNSTHLDPDKIQKLTYKMCHLYYNWPGTIRVPAPCQVCTKQPKNYLRDRTFCLFGLK